MQSLRPTGMAHSIHIFKKEKKLSKITKPIGQIII